MFSLLAVLVYLVALGLPIYLLIQFHSQAWYWHALAVFAALALGLVPIPVWLQSSAYDLVLGFVFIFLMVWGAGGLILFRTHHEKHA
jgi:hypothetical protein